ncbi:hypothetical protein FH972_023295 [Carpinus fangiana]|uniref:Uncharacterized protein n=1 Tax=Carpinus fangiana TaxID=176857 RepID=A0A5N6KUS5_9ROSI|nr:hypothetical protein FH972_023295 [Carpinus fangiana]
MPGMQAVCPFQFIRRNPSSSLVLHHFSLLGTSSLSYYLLALTLLPPIIQGLQRAAQNTAEVGSGQCSNSRVTMIRSRPI